MEGMRTINKLKSGLYRQMLRQGMKQGHVEMC